MPKGKPSPTKSAKSKVGDDTGIGLLAIAKAIDGLSEEFHKMYYLEMLADHLADAAVGLHDLAHATALSVIARNGTEDERRVAIEHLKHWFHEDFPHP